MHYGLWRRLAVWLEYRFSAHADLIIANSIAGCDHCIKIGFPKERMAVVHNGIDTDFFLPQPTERNNVRAELGISENISVIGHVARISPSKDQRTAVNAIRIFVSRHPDARFVFVGNDSGGKYNIQGMLHQDDNDLNICDNVSWIGPRDDVVRLLAAFDIVTLSSVREGFSNALSEAMAAGVPVVATSVGDSALIVNNLGEVVPPRDPEALAAAWSRLLERRRQEGTKLTDACRTHIVKNFGIDVMASRTLKHYQRLTSSNPADRVPEGQD